MPATGETVLSQLGHHVFGTGIVYYALQYSTFAILVLAANTSFADFPRLGSILAQKPTCRASSRRAATASRSRTASSALALVAMLLVWLFHGDTTALIPLYAIGVFVCFTLSQAGMVRALVADASARVAVERAAQRRRRDRDRRRLRDPDLDEVHAWRVDRRRDHSAVHPAAARRSRRHYVRFAIEIQLDGTKRDAAAAAHVVVPVSGVHKAVANALDLRDGNLATTCARSTSKWSRRRPPALEAEWDLGHRHELIVLPSPYR